jgi:hypothetical protein
MSALPEPRPWSRAARTAPYSPSQPSNATVTRLSPAQSASVSLVAVDGEQALLVQQGQIGIRDLSNVRTLPTAAVMPTHAAPSSSTGTAADSRLCSRRHVMPFALAWSTILALVLAGVRFGLLPDVMDLATLGAMVGWSLYIEVRNEH